MTRPLLAILILAVALRLAAALAMGNDVETLPGVYDQVSYMALARQVAEGQGFRFTTDSWPATRAGEPTAHWSFLYTGFLALAYQLIGPYPLAARLIQALLVGILLPLGLFQLGRQTLGERVGLWAAGLSAVYIYFIYYGAALMTESFTIVALVWLMVVAIGLARSPSVRRPSWGGWIAFGLLAGIAALLRQVTLPVTAVLAVWVLWSGRKRPGQTIGRAAAGAVLAAAIALALILPVTFRNYQAFHRFVLINTNAGYAFFWANHPVHGINFQGILPADGPSYQDLIPAELLPLDEAALNDALMARGMAFIREDPARYLMLSVSRLEDYFKFWPAADSSRTSNLSRMLSFGILLPFMLYGLVLSRSHWRECLPLYLFIGTYTMIHLLSWALIRYRLPVDAVLLVFAGLACEQLFGRRVAALIGPRAMPVLPL